MEQLKKVTGINAQRYPYRISVGERSINFTVDPSTENVKAAQSLDVFEKGTDKLVVEFYSDRHGEFKVSGNPRISKSNSVGVTSMAWPLIHYMHRRVEQRNGRPFEKDMPIESRQFLNIGIDDQGRAIFDMNK